MKKSQTIFILALIFLSIFTTIGQNSITIKGIVKDSNTFENIYGAKIAILPNEGDNELITSYSDMTGTFSLKTNITENRIKISFLNYKSTIIAVNQISLKDSKTIDLETIFLENDINKQIENTSSIVDVVENRKSPIASSTLFQSDIQTQASNKDFIELVSDMPGAYVSRMGGGFGDSQLRVRGFDQNNLTPMVDGISLYDLETGNVDWTGLMTINEAVTSIQLQKGLGASKLVNSSVAGTVNFILKEAFSPRGGSLFVSSGNNGYRKFGASYGTGKMENGLGFNFMLNNVTGDGYVNNTNFNATGYFIALGYENNKNNFQFKLLGTPQWHNQRNTPIALFQYYDANEEKMNSHYNKDWGYYNNDTYTAESNNSHKPMATLQWDYKFNNTDQLSVKAYGTKGKSSDIRLNGDNVIFNRSPYLTSENGLLNNTAQIDFDFIHGYNSGQLSYFRYDPSINGYRDAINGLYLNSIVGEQTYTGVSQIANNKEINSYGSIVNIDKQLGKVIKVNTGIDYRKTSYQNYRTIENLFGADGYAINNNYSELTSTVNAYQNYITNSYSTESNIWNIFKKVGNEKKVNYDYTSKIDYLGAYAQIEANFKKVNLLAQGGFNRQFLSRKSNNLLSNESKNSNSVNIDGYNVKLGANFNITDKHNLWINGGIVSRAPIYTNVFSSYSEIPNQQFKNEQFYSAEAGYGFTSSIASLKINGYYANHEDSTIPYASEFSGFLGATTDINRKNYGVEAELNIRPTKRIDIYASFSYGEWKYTSDAKFTYYDRDEVNTLFVKDNNVGGIPQTMANLGFKAFITKGLQFGVKGRYNDRFYTNAPIERFDPVTYENSYFNSVVELPSYLVFDTFINYTLALQNQHKINICFNLDNALDRNYIMESNSSYGNNQQIPTTSTTYGEVFGNYKGVSKINNAYLGFGRTWNLSVRYNF